MRRHFLTFAVAILAFSAISGSAFARTHAAAAPASAAPVDTCNLLCRLFGGPAASSGQPGGVAPPREMVAYSGPYAPGTIIISTQERRLYYILPGNQAVRYGVGVGRQGFEWSGVRTVTAKREWPDWTPPSQMLRRRPDLPRHMAGGPENPLGSRAMYLGGTLYRIHGSNEPGTIGTAVSSGCIRMTNEDVQDLYNRVRVGTRVIVQR
ncbi:L,D-transpeptidase [Methyloferula stellata]|uniref:L,D-transpeptidase n=1 Tax=Methyloferula stellata TaxID=876270 RepID=UPI00047AB902|nr:L,D-transpeptidase [Methyloferula stellata]